MHRRSGVSLPELLVVLGLLTIIVGVSMPYLLGAIRNSDFNAAVRQVGGDARFARSLAVSKGGYYRLQTQANSYRLEHSSSGSWASPDVISNWQDLSNLYGGVTIQSVSTSDGAIFNSTGASVDSSNAPRPVSITLHKPDGTTKAIQVDPAGNVKLQ
jgi:Tfp pilus assembly protein FimT